jgi:hypothetical protein
MPTGSSDDCTTISVLPLHILFYQQVHGQVSARRRLTYLTLSLVPRPNYRDSVAPHRTAEGERKKAESGVTAGVFNAIQVWYGVEGRKNRAAGSLRHKNGS